MTTKTTTLVIVALVGLAGLAGPATAQQNGQHRGQESEFGTILTPFSAEVDGQRVPIEAQVALRKDYSEKDSRFFMFGWTWQNSPGVDVEFTNLVRTDTGEDLPCFEGLRVEKDQVKCFVDLKHMPPVGTEIIMRGTVGASRAGSHQVGAIVLPFTYTWEQVTMSNGLPAELYSYTVVTVKTPTSGSGGPIIGGAGNIPGVGAVGAVAAIGAVAAGLAIVRRKKR